MFTLLVKEVCALGKNTKNAVAYPSLLHETIRSIAIPLDGM